MHTNAQALDEVIRQRRTLKMLAAEPLPASTQREVINEVIAAGAWAPFHKPSSSTHRGELNSFVPWRAYALDAAACRRLREKLIEVGDTTKIVQMLAAAEALIQVTWLPNPAKSETDALFEPTLENMEHLAAASAAVQNMLLTATARGFENYWSSGGALREKLVFDWMGIPATEILLGGIFLFPAETDNVETAEGKLRHKRGDVETWAKWIS
ncbi:nitroreductase family protein [Cerasicoccus maritimus]|uniref:nitroreductase family protein n=1 Tax=Cerasicoccus maritimus TaxID=490089 RepID=UPI0028528A3E|nr:nitroreductase family protein [Cerasicoccus maritimus]